MQKYKKNYLKMLGVMCAIFLLLMFLYHCCGHKLIHSMYTQTSLSVLNSVISGQISKPVEYYYSISDSAFSGFQFFFILIIAGGIIIFFLAKQGTTMLLLSLLYIDMCMVIMHFTHSGLWSINIDRYIPEIFQYTKEIFLASIFILFYIKTKQRIYIWSSAAFSYLLLDDSFLLHETGGKFLINNFYFFSKIADFAHSKSQDIGEASFLAIIGLMFFVIFIWAFLKSDKVSRKNSLTIFVLIFFAAFFGIVVDFVHAMFKGSCMTDFFVVLEEMGEMVVISYICFFSSKIFLRDSCVNRELADRGLDVKSE